MSAPGDETGRAENRARSWSRRVSFDAICATLPLESGAYEPEVNANGESPIWIERLWTAQAAAR